MKKNILIFSSVALLTSGCAPKITSIQSPINKLDKRCFVLPNKTHLSKRSINEQKLYQLTYNSLHKYGVYASYGKTKNCKNYLNTQWKVSTGSETVTTGGLRQTNTYGNIYDNRSYYNPYSYAQTSQTYVTPTTTYTQSTYYGTYYLEVGILKNSSTTKVWEASQSSQLGATTIQEAQSVTNDSQSIVDTMVEKMLIENNFIKK